MKQALLSLTVNITNPEKLRAYVNENALNWGFDEGYFDDKSDETLAEAVYEAVVLNRCTPLDIGIEITDRKHIITRSASFGHYDPESGEWIDGVDKDGRDEDGNRREYW